MSEENAQQGVIVKGVGGLYYARSDDGNIHVLRAKGIVDTNDEQFLYFDYVPGESEIRQGAPDYTGKICVIGSNLKEENLKELFK